MNEESAGEDRLKPFLAHRYPVRFGKLVDARLPSAERGEGP
jgi:hypothetical protein